MKRSTEKYIALTFVRAGRRRMRAAICLAMTQRKYNEKTNLPDSSVVSDGRRGLTRKLSFRWN